MPAWRWKQRMGGSMRQAGICAAACVYALDNNVARLAEDHANARRLAAGLAQIPGVRVVEPDTNLVYMDIAGTGVAPDAFIHGLRRDGVMVSGLNGMIRLCTHLDVTAAAIEEAVQIIRARLQGG
jgi:threonine aldolase